MRALFVIILLAALVLPTAAFAEVQTFTATHTYILGDHDSKDDARQRCLLEAKRKILEQAGVYIESASEVKNLDLTKDKITSFAAAVMQVKDTKEEVGFENEHMTLTMTLTATVDSAEIQKLLAARQMDAGMQERLKRLEAQLEAMLRQQGGQSSRQTPAFPPSDLSAADLQTLRTRAAQSDADAQKFLGEAYFLGHGVPRDAGKARQWYEKAAAQGNVQAQAFLGTMYKLGIGGPQDKAQGAQWYEKAAAQGHARAQELIGLLYDSGDGVPQNHTKARQWYEKAAAQADAEAQYDLGVLYDKGQGVLQDYATARGWFERAAAQGHTGAQYSLGFLYAYGEGGPQNVVRAYMWLNLAAAHSTGGDQIVAAGFRDDIARRMTPAQIAAAQQLSQLCQVQQFKGC